MSLNFESTQRIGDIVLERPATMRVFERLDLDYCCGGHRTLAEAAERAGKDLAEVQAALQADESPATVDPRSLASGSLRELIDYIESTHHVFTRTELARVAPLVEKVAQVHGDRHPELAAVRELFLTLQADLLPHLEKEERILFPYIRTLEGGAAACEACFGTVRGPVSVMQSEHEEAGEILRRLRALTGGYQAPEDGCATYRSMLAHGPGGPGVRPAPPHLPGEPHPLPRGHGPGGRERLGCLRLMLEGPPLGAALLHARDGIRRCRR